MKSETIFVLAVMTAVVSSVASIGTTAYGGDTGYGVDNPPELGETDQDTGLVGSIIGTVTGAVTSILRAFIPQFTGIWVIDNWLINPLLTVAVYWLVEFGRGI